MRDTPGAWVGFGKVSGGVCTDDGGSARRRSLERECSGHWNSLRDKISSAKHRGDQGCAHLALNRVGGWRRRVDGVGPAAAHGRSSGSGRCWASPGSWIPLVRLLELLWRCYRCQGGMWSTGGDQSRRRRDLPAAGSGRNPARAGWRSRAASSGKVLGTGRSSSSCWPGLGGRGVAGPRRSRGAARQSGAEAAARVGGGCGVENGEVQRCGCG
jgi:hypothetical protein